MKDDAVPLRQTFLPPASTLKTITSVLWYAHQTWLSAQPITARLARSSPA